MKKVFLTVSKPNILLIVVDSLKSDKCIGKNLSSITPNIDFLIKNGTSFPNTIPSVAKDFGLTCDLLKPNIHFLNSN